MMFPAIVALIVAVSLGACLVEMLGSIDQFSDPHDWEEYDGD